jgi:hypothetical protein
MSCPATDLLPKPNPKLAGCPRPTTALLHHWSSTHTEEQQTLQATALHLSSAGMHKQDAAGALPTSTAQMI